MADNRQLQFELTAYGRERIAKALSTPGMNLALTKIKIGSGKDNEYYELTEDMLNDPNLELQGYLGQDFYVFDKELLEDNLTVSFHTIIPETVGGFDIREVGLYEVTNEGEKLFAISVQQPFIKPSAEYNYFISINYYMFLRNTNLASLYDRITLDVEHAQVSEADLEELMRTFLFAQENLMLQMGKNTQIIGYNRPSQLLERINENKQDYSYITLYKNFASLLDMIDSPSDIFAYWIFDYSRRETIGSNIVDLSDNKYYLTTNKVLNSYPHLYEGFQSMFSFSESDNYSLPAGISIDLYDADNNKDLPFTMVFTLEPHPDYYNKARTIIAKSNRALGSSVFEIQELPKGILWVRLYSSKDNYVTFVSNEGVIPNLAHSIVLTYNPDELQMTAYVNAKSYLLKKEGGESYEHMNPSAGGTLYEYSCNPVYRINTGTDIIDDTPQENVVFCKDNGETIYPVAWTLEEDESEIKVFVEINGQQREASAEGDPTTEDLYAWGYWVTENPDVTTEPLYLIYIKNSEGPGEDEILYDENFQEVPQSDEGFHIIENAESPTGYSIEYGAEPITKVKAYSTGDIQRTIQAYEYISSESIYTNTDTIEGGQSYPLYKLSGTNVYVDYTGSAWKFEGTSLYFTDPNSTEVKWQGILNPTPIQTPVPPLTSYIVDENNVIQDNINSNVGIISIIKEKLSPTNARILALNLCATLGKNPFLDGD